MREIILIAHVSLDGFVADINGKLHKFRPGEENLAFVAEISKAADTILMGRKTYDLLNEYWSTIKDAPDASPAQIAYSTWYAAAGKLVISNTLQSEHHPELTIVTEPIIEYVSQIKQSEGQAIVIFTSPSITQRLMEHNLIDTYWLFFNPLFFGKGIPLFNNPPDSISLKLCEIKRFENEELAVKYSRETV